MNLRFRLFGKLNKNQGLFRKDLGTRLKTESCTWKCLVNCYSVKSFSQPLVPESVSSKVLGAKSQMSVSFYSTNFKTL